MATFECNINRFDNSEVYYIFLFLTSSIIVYWKLFGGKSQSQHNYNKFMHWLSHDSLVDIRVDEIEDWSSNMND